MGKNDNMLTGHGVAYIQDLVDKAMLEKAPSGGRHTNYLLKNS
jgi:hypothetical protein